MVAVHAGFLKRTNLCLYTT